MKGNKIQSVISVPLYVKRMGKYVVVIYIIKFSQ